MLAIQLVSNLQERTNHSTRLDNLFNEAKRFDCYVAFANWNGLGYFWDSMVAAVEAGTLTARFVLGLDFFHTEPDTLYALKELAENNPRHVELYISGSGSKLTFHPKIYAFQYPDEICRVFVGSANLTQGGLADNIEASLFYEHTNCKLVSDLDNEFLSWLESGEIEKATDEALAEYARKHRIYSLHRRAAQVRAERACAELPPAGPLPYLDDLAAILDLMKADETDSNFDVQVAKRAASLPVARRILDTIRTTPKLTANTFLDLYEELVSNPGHAWHSGSLHRRRVTVAQSYATFQNALMDLHRTLGSSASAADAYGVLLLHFAKASHVGPNIMSEILHSYDSSRFAVMNQNSVSGILMARYTQFPSRPMKATVTPQVYQEFCDCAEAVRAGLGLRDLSEVDAVFNYAYWD
ncbi:restriction endonuclease PLD domain-containing protein [Zoogloea sp.]|uniref:restriction endonuclease PLD domain-containing protein n=1 Tax=Zoogloea sp. TaxID=49181 RepID=UPI0035B0C03B